MSHSAWVWRRGELLGRTRYVLALPHPNARVPAHGVAGSLGPQLTTELRTFLRSWTPQTATARTRAPPPPRAASHAAPASHHSPAAAPDHRRAAEPVPPRSPRLFAITTGLPHHAPSQRSGHWRARGRRYGRQPSRQRGRLRRARTR